MNNKLKAINFSTGIHAKDIQNNFDVLEERELRDRLRTSGLGIVEGFKLSLEEGDNVKVGEGFFINQEGREIIVLEKSLHIDPPQAVRRTMTASGEALLVNIDGEITLPERPYSESRQAHFDTNSYQESFAAKENELIIRNAKNQNEKIQAVRIDGRTITLDAESRRGQEVFVEYSHASGRVDFILLSRDGKVTIEKGTDSEAPSHLSIPQYEAAGFMILGLVESKISGLRTITLHEDYRTYTKVYVDEKNTLHLNGKAYEEAKMINFEEPVVPKIDDIWFDKESNILMIWKDEGGEYGWSAITGSTNIPVRQIKIFPPEDFPKDKRTFLFTEEDLALRFIPGHNQIEIIIDNSPLMSDQFEEVIDQEAGEFINAGIGFKLKEELDKATYVEIRVHHSVQARALRRTFQRTAIFAHEGFAIHSITNIMKEFVTDSPYVMGEHQLQVYVNGSRMQEGLDFEEIPASGVLTSAANKGRSSKTFKVRTDLNPGDRVSYRVEKNIYSYDNLDGWVDKIELKADQALTDVLKLNQDLATTENNIGLDINAINNNILALTELIGDMSGYYKKTDKISRSSLPNESVLGTKRSIISKTEIAKSLVTVENTNMNDYVSVFYASHNTQKILIKDVDYVLQEKDLDLLIILESDYVDEAATLYISGIRFGI